MDAAAPGSARQRLEAALREQDTAAYVLTLFVSGASASSARAVRNVQAICATHLAGRHELTIVDIHQNPEQVRGHRILATPTLIKSLPEPVRMLVGDMSDLDRVLTALNLAPAPHPNGAVSA